MREEPRGAGEQQDVGAGAAKSSTPSALLIEVAVVVRLVVAARAFFSPRNRRPSSSAAFSTSSSRLWIALWLVAATPTRRPRRISSVISRAPVHVLPVPGGPWMKR